MAVYSTLAELEQAISKELNAGMQEGMSKVYAKLSLGINQFYSRSNPRAFYERTYALANAPRRQFWAGTKQCTFKVWLDTNGEYEAEPLLTRPVQGHEYGWAAPDLRSYDATFHRANTPGYDRGYPVIGREGFWDRTEDASEELVVEALKKRLPLV